MTSIHSVSAFPMFVCLFVLNQLFKVFDPVPGSSSAEIEINLGIIFNRKHYDDGKHREEVKQLRSSC